MKIRSNIILWGNFYGFIVMGLINVFFGLMMPYFRETYSLSYEQGGLILALLATGSLIFGFVSGIIGDIIGMKKVLIFGHITYTVGLLGIAITNSVLILYIGIFITGIGWGACNTSINMYINDYTNGNGKAMNLLHMCFCIGAFSIPMLSNILIKQGLYWKNILLILVALELFSIIFAFYMKAKPKAHKSQPKIKSKIDYSIFTNIRLYIFMIVLFFYVGAESSISGWIVTYIIDGLGYSSSFSQSIFSLFWIGMIVGRFTNSIISDKIDAKDIVVFSSIGGLIMMILFLKASTPIIIGSGIFLIALMFSGIYPLTIAGANPIINGSGSALALVTLGGGIGSMVVPYIGGKVAETSGIGSVIIVIIISLIFLSIFAIINKKDNKKTGDISAQKVI